MKKNAFLHFCVIILGLLCCLSFSNAFASNQDKSNNDIVFVPPSGSGMVVEARPVALTEEGIDEIDPFVKLVGNDAPNHYNTTKRIGDFIFAVGFTGTANSLNTRGIISKFDLSGNLLWTAQLNSPSSFNDLVETDNSNADFMIVGRSEPVRIISTWQDNQSIICSIDANGNFNWINHYDQNNRENMMKIIRSPNPVNPSFPFYIAGVENTTTDPSTSDYVNVFNLNSAGSINWKNQYLIDSDNEFVRDFLALSTNGDVALFGNHLGLDGTIVTIDGNGVVKSNETFDVNPNHYFRGAVEIVGTNDYYLIGEEANSHAFIARFDKQGNEQWSYKMGTQIRFTKIDQAGNGDLYVVGQGTVDGISRFLVNKFTSAGQYQWTRYIDKGEQAYLNACLDVLAEGNILYSDCRQDHPDGFGDYDVLVGIFDLEMNSECTVDFTDVVIDSFFLNSSPVSVDVEDLIVTSNQTGDGDFLEWNCVEGCEAFNPTCCTDFNAFCQKFDAGFITTVDTCSVTITPIALDMCHQVTYDFDGTIVGPVSGATPVSHTFSQTGDYLICATVDELDSSGMSCWQKDTCWTVCVTCDTCDIVCPPDLYTLNHSLDFDSADDYVEIPDACELTPDEFTIEAWVKSGGGGGQTIKPIFTKYNTANNDDHASYALILMPDSSFLFGVYQSSSPNIHRAIETNPAIITPGVWYHVAATFSLATDVLNFYLDGVLLASSLTGNLTAGSSPDLTSIFRHPEPVNIGRVVFSNAAEHFFYGKIDEVRFWNTVRSPADILNNKDTELAGTESGLISYYKMDDPTSACDVIDCNTYENHGMRKGLASTNNLPQYSTDVAAAIASANVACEVCVCGTGMYVDCDTICTPQIVCPPDIIIDCCDTLTLADVMVIDSCGIDTIICTREDGLGLGDPFGPGTTCITCVTEYDNTCLINDKVLASDGSSFNNFGRSTAVSGNYGIIGSPNDPNPGGSAFIFKNNSNNWIEDIKLVASDGQPMDNFGWSVAMDGDYAIVGAFRDDDSGNDSGAAYIFHRNGNTWIEQAKLLASDGQAGGLFGGSVSISGDYAIVAGMGAVYVFHRNGSSWIEQAKLLASDGANGDLFGNDVSISGDYILIGAHGDDDNGGSSGSAYVFHRNGNTWIEQAKLLASDGDIGDGFGSIVSISGDYIVLGALGDNDNGSFSGSAYVFYRNGTTWVEQAKLLASDGAINDSFGSVSISGDYIIVSAYADDDNGNNSGSLYLFKRNGTAWVEQKKLLPFDGDINDIFGIHQAVAISDNHILAGSPADDDNGGESGSAYFYDLNSLPTGAIDTCTFCVTVLDNPPSIVCPADVTIDCTESSHPSNTGMATGTDECDTDLTYSYTDVVDGADPCDTLLTRQWIATDSCGQMDTCYQLIHKVDVTPPQITFCPAAITVSGSFDANGDCVITMNLPLPTAIDDCNNPVVLNYVLSGATVGSGSSNNANETLNQGSTTVTWTPEDICGNTGISCSYTITLDDCPIICPVTCPPSLTINSDPGSCGAVGSNLPTVDPSCNCTISDDYLIPASVVPDFFPVGTTPITYTVKCPGQPIVTCPTTVTVIDNEPPTITCPPSQTIHVSSAATSVNATFAAATAIDNCQAIVTCDYNSGDSFPIGCTTVTCTATDGAGNTDVCTFDICIIQDPDCVCENGSDIGANLIPEGDFSSNSNSWFSTDYNYHPTGIGMVAGDIYIHNNTSIFPANISGQWDALGHTNGTTNDYFLAVDGSADNTDAAMRFNVPVMDGASYNFCLFVNNLHLPPNDQLLDPIIAVSINGTTVISGTTIEEVPDQWIQLTGSWTAAGVTNATIVIRTLETFDPYNDFAIDDISFRQCTMPPTCQSDFTFNYLSCGQVQFFDAATSSSSIFNWDWEIDGVQVSTGNNPNITHQFLSSGSHNVCLSIDDQAGCTDQFCQTITVNFNDSPPQITCPGDQVFNVPDGSCFSDQDPNIAAISASNLCDLNDIVVCMRSDGLPLNDPYPVHTTVTISCVGSNSFGSSAPCTFNVETVSSCNSTFTFSPVSNPFFCGAYNFTNTSAGGCSLQWDFGGLGTSNQQNPSFTFPPGTYQVCLTSTPGSDCPFTHCETVVVNYGISPAISCPDDITEQTASGNCEVVLPNPATTIIRDFCAQNIQDGCTRSDGLALSDPFPVGVTTVTCAATDEFGVDMCSYIVTVEDNEPPTPPCPPDVMVNVPQGSTGGIASFFLIQPVDNCPGNIIVDGPMPLVSGDFFPLGCTTLSMSAIDASLNQTDCFFQVCVEEACNDCSDFTNDVDAGYFPPIITYGNNCIRTFIPKQLGPCDQVEWIITASGITLTDNSVGNAPVVFSLQDGIVYKVRMKVTRTLPDGTICQPNPYEYFDSYYLAACIPAFTCNASGVVQNGDFQNGSSGWSVDAGNPSFESAMGCDDEGYVVLSGNSEVSDIISQDVSDLPSSEEKDFLISVCLNPEESSLKPGTRLIVRTANTTQSTIDCVGEDCDIIGIIDIGDGGDDWSPQNPMFTKYMFNSIIFQVENGEEDDGTVDSRSVIAIDNICIEAIDIIVSTQNIHFGYEVNIFPNPTSENVQVKFAEVLKEELNYRVLDLWGRVLQSGTFEPGYPVHSLAMSNYPDGVYIIEIGNTKQGFYREKIIKHRP